MPGGQLGVEFIGVEVPGPVLVTGRRLELGVDIERCEMPDARSESWSSEDSDFFSGWAEVAAKVGTEAATWPRSAGTLTGGRSLIFEAETEVETPGL
jgi:hypothetical protein